MSEAEQKGKKRSKSRYMGSGKRQKGFGQLEVGMQGILITYNTTERMCVREAYSLLNEYGDQLYGAEKLCDSVFVTEEDDDDVGTALEKEVEEILSSTEHNLRRFQFVESGAINIVFIRTLNVEPEKLVHHILKDMHITKKKKARIILRMLPVSGTCRAYPADLEKYAEKFLELWFKTPNKGTFQITFKNRNINHMNPDNVTKDLARIVENLNPENKMDLLNPEYTIIVKIINNICCLSVVKDYILFRKYNLQEVVKIDRKQIAPSVAGTNTEGNSEDTKKEPKVADT